MKRVFQNIFLIICIFSTIFISGCDKNGKTMILMSSKPIEYNSHSDERLFKKSSRINIAVLYTKPPKKTHTFLIQVFKMNSLSRMWGYTLEYGKKIEADPDKNYFLTHFYIHSTGDFIINVFTEDNLKTPFAKGEFWVEE